MKKYGYSEMEVRGFINQMINLSDVEPLNKESTLNALNIKEKYRLRACSDFGFWAAHGKFYFKVR